MFSICQNFGVGGILRRLEVCRVSGVGGGRWGVGGWGVERASEAARSEKINNGEYLKRKLVIYWRIGIKKNCKRKRGNFGLFKSWRLNKYPLPCRALTQRNYYLSAVSSKGYEINY
jgi:hypothetical protein